MAVSSSHSLSAPLHDCELLFKTVSSLFITVSHLLNAVSSLFMPVSSLFMTVSSLFTTLSNLFSRGHQEIPQNPSDDTRKQPNLSRVASKSTHTYST